MRRGVLRAVGSLTLLMAMSWPAGSNTNALSAAWTTADFGRCSKALKTCIGMTLHVAVGEDGRFQLPKGWVRSQIRHANRLFAPMRMGFEVAAIEPLPASVADVQTRSHRDALGRARFSQGTVDVFLVKRLANVDEPGLIRGVHWRLRSDVSKRWVILAGYAAAWVLAHELGHFFSLPHSKYPSSVMNKRPSTKKYPRPAASERGFVKPERTRILRDLRRQLKTGAVVARRTSRSRK